MQGVLQRLRRIASRYTTGQKIGFVLIAVLLATGAFLLFRYVGKPQYRVLFSGLDSKDAAAVTAALEEMKVDYKVEGSSVLVPAGEVDKLRMQLAARNIPSGGKVGFEIFDKTSFGASDFSQRVNYQRALEGELARTISSLDQVESAVVHIALPEESIFTDKENSASASVLVSLKGGQTLERSQVEGIRNLVACAVEGLKPENVSIVDSSGNPLYAGDEGSALASDRLQIVRSYQSYMEGSLQKVLDQVLGPGKGLVKVHLELDLASRTTQTEKYQSPQEGGLPGTAKTSEEVYNNASGTTSGVPGTGSNIPDYTSITTGGTGAAYTKRESEIAYDNNRTVVQEISPPGEITGINLSVLLDQSVDSSSVYALQEALAAAAGLDQERGDTITVQTVPFDTSQQEQREAQLAKARSGERIMSLARLGGLVLAALLGAFLLWRRLRKVKERISQLPALESSDTYALEEAAENARALMGKLNKSPILSSLELMASQRPDEVAKLLKAMMQERS